MCPISCGNANLRHQVNDKIRYKTKIIEPLWIINVIIYTLVNTSNKAKNA